MALSKRLVETKSANGLYHKVEIRREGTTVNKVTIYVDQEDGSMDWIDLNLEAIGEFMECCEFIKQQLDL